MPMSTPVPMRTTPTRATTPRAARAPAKPVVAFVAAVAIASRTPADAATMFVGAGDEAFLERQYLDLKYAGVRDVAPGALDGARGVRVTYDESRISFEELMRTYWRRSEPTRSDGQFSEVGARFAPVIYVANADERAIVERARDDLEASNVYGAGAKLTVRVLDGAPETFEEAPERDALRANPKKYAKMLKARDAAFNRLWGFVQFCADRVCGYVRFAPNCKTTCLKVFPEYEARNAGIPDIDAKNIKITARN